MPHTFSTTTATGSTPAPSIDLSDDIAVNAGQDRSVTIDGQTTTAHGFSEQIEARMDEWKREAVSRKARWERGR